jgi:hypothetical protein
MQIRGNSCTVKPVTLGTLVSQPPVRVDHTSTVLAECYDRHFSVTLPPVDLELWPQFHIFDAILFVQLQLLMLADLKLYSFYIVQGTGQNPHSLAEVPFSCSISIFSPQV